MVGWQEKFLNSRRSRMAKTVTFWRLVSLLIVPALKLSLFPLFSFFFFTMQKNVEREREGGGGAWPTAPQCCQSCKIIRVMQAKPLI